MYAVYPLPADRPLDPRLGLKALNLARLCTLAPALGFSVPSGFVLPPQALDDLLAATLPPGVRAAEVYARLVERRDVDAARRWRERLALIGLPRALEATLHHHHPRITDRVLDRPLVVRSSFHAEDGADHSFAGIFDTALDVVGVDMLCRAVRSVLASVLSDRALAYLNALQHLAIPAMSVIVQPMVGREGGRGGVLHTRAEDLATSDVLLIAASDQAHAVTSGDAIPEEYLVHRPNLARGRACLLAASAGTATARRGFAMNDRSVRPLAELGVALEHAFGTPLEIEWVETEEGTRWVLQARALPTVSPHSTSLPTVEAGAEPLVTGLGVGHGSFTGRVRRTEDRTVAAHLGPTDVLVTSATDPDWDAAVAGAGALVTAAGGRTSHAARLARERGTLAVVGCGAPFGRLVDGTLVTLVCIDGVSGHVYRAADVGAARAPVEGTARLVLDRPSEAFARARTASPAVVDVRLDAVLRALRVFPLPAPDARPSPALAARIAGYADVRAFLTGKLKDTLALVAAAFPHARIEVAAPASALADCRPALEAAVAWLRIDYGFPVGIVPRTYTSSERLPPQTTS
jgi:pyruvate,water dikinase